MNGLFGIWCKLCALMDVITRLCEKTDQAIANNEVLCTKIEGIVGDPDAECPECAEPAEGGAVEQERVQTAAAVATTEQIRVVTESVKAKFAKTAEKVSEKVAG